MLAAIPVVEVAQYRDISGVGSPHREIDPGNALNLGVVRAQFFVNAVVVALAKQVNVEIGDGAGFEGVGVVDDVDMATADIFELVVGQILHFEDALKEVGIVVALHGHFLVLLWQHHPGLFGLGQVGPHSPDGLAVLLHHVGA